MAKYELGLLDKMKIYWNTQAIPEDVGDLFTGQSLSSDTK